VSVSRLRARSWVALLVVSLGLTGVASSTPAIAASAVQYKVTIIRNPGSAQNVQLLGINQNGDVFGTAFESGAQTEEAFLLKAGSTTMQFLGSPGDPGNKKSSADPKGINGSADVVGFSLNTRDTPLEWADSLTPTNLGNLGALAGQPAQATGINDSNEIVGYTETHGWKPFKIQNGKVSALPVLPDGGFDARPLAISSTGLIVGDADSATSNLMAVQWTGSGAITRLAQLPNTFMSQAFAVNSSGVAVGAAVLSTDDVGHAVMWANGKVSDLQAPLTGGGDAMANAINDNGVIVGVGGGNAHGFVYRNGVATDLNTLIAPTAGLTLFGAFGISHTGIIVGDATLNGQNVGYELTPLS
jgi:probable HAF family extracellular repeat protein